MGLPLRKPVSRQSWWGRTGRSTLWYGFWRVTRRLTHFQLHFGTCTWKAKTMSGLGWGWVPRTPELSQCSSPALSEIRRSITRSDTISRRSRPCAGRGWGARVQGHGRGECLASLPVISCGDKRTLCKTHNFFTSHYRVVAGRVFSHSLKALGKKSNLRKGTFRILRLIKK